MDINKNWILWTVWSKEIKEKTQEQITTDEFLKFFMNLVHRKDKSFDVPSSTTNTLIIKPRKIAHNSSNNELYITGAVFKPGEKVQGGKTWKLIAIGDLATILKSDSQLFSANGLTDLFIVIGGTVNSSSRQVLLNSGVGNGSPTKIIRFSNTATCLPPIFHTVSTKNFDLPYKNVAINNQILHLFKLVPKHYPGIILKTGCRTNVKLNQNNQTTNNKQVSSSSSRKIPTTKEIPVSQRESRSSPEVQIIKIVIPSPPPTGSVLQTSNQNSNISKIVKKRNIEHVNENNNNIQEKRRRTSSPSLNNNNNNRRNLSTEIVVDDSPPPPRQNNNQGGILDLGKQDRHYKYYTLEELEEKLNNSNCSIKNANLWGMVESVLEVPTDDEFEGRRYPDEKHHSAKYVIRISDSSKSNVLTRLCTRISNGLRRFPHYKIGPRMEPLTIICIHRATVQYEMTDSPNGKVREMVVSTTPHLNYTLFNHDQDVDGEIIHQRLADKPPELKNTHITTIKSLRRLIISRSASQNRSQPIPTTPSSSSQRQEQQQPPSATIHNTTLVLRNHSPNNQTTPPVPHSSTQLFRRHACNTAPSKNPNTQAIHRNLRSSQSLTPQNKQIKNVQNADSSLFNESFLADAQESQENILNNTVSDNNGVERNEIQIAGDVLMDIEGDNGTNSGNQQSNSQHNQSILDLENSHETTTESYGSQEFTVEQAQFFCKLDKSAKTTMLPIKLEKVHSGRKSSFHLMCVVHNMMEMTGDKIVLRISDGTVPLTAMKQFDEFGNLEELRDVAFVDLVVTNISKNPEARERLEECVGTNRDMVLLYISVNVSRDPNGSEIVQLMGDAEKIGVYWVDKLC